VTQIQFPVASAPEHVCYRNHDGCTSGDRLLNRSVGIIDFEHYADSRASECAWTPASPAFARAELVANEQSMPMNLNLTMQKFFAIWAHHPRTFNGTERTFVKFQRYWTHRVRRFPARCCRA
jgi:hypothetical protein